MSDRLNYIGCLSCDSTDSCTSVYYGQTTIVHLRPGYRRKTAITWRRRGAIVTVQS